MFTLRPFFAVYAFAALGVALLAGTTSPECHAELGLPKSKSVWDLTRLSNSPEVEWTDHEASFQAIHFTGEPYRGKPTKVFAYYARPGGNGPFPAMVLLHGGGGKAFAEWAKLWAERGYVALAIDLAGHGPDGKRLPDGGPNQDDQSKFGKFDESGVRDMWTYHAVADAMLGHSLLAAQPEVDKERIGVTGISWGGYLTCIVAGVDPRFKVAVPVYGCGFIHENSCWVEGYFKKMEEDQHARWVKHFDPSSHLGGVRCPILFVNGTNDFAYPLDSYQASYNLVPEKLRHLCVTVNMPHGHPQGWAPREIGWFVDSVLKDGAPLARLSSTELDGESATSNVIMTDADKAVVLESAQLHYTTDSGPWQKRTWKSIPASIHDDELRATLPNLKDTEEDSAHLVLFFTARDERGATVSSPHLEMAP